MLRDHLGKPIAYFHRKSNLKSILELEIEAALEGIKLVTDFQINNIWIEMDFEIAIKCISGNSTTPWCIARNCSSIKSLLQRFFNWEFHTHGEKPIEWLTTWLRLACINLMLCCGLFN